MSALITNSCDPLYTRAVSPVCRSQDILQEPVLTFHVASMALTKCITTELGHGPVTLTAAGFRV